MPDLDRDLIHLFVRDLDDIELPPRDRWRPAPRRESRLMRTGRYVLYASAVVAVLVLALFASFAFRDSNRAAATPSPTLPANTASASVPSPTASVATGRYASAGLGYSIETPAPWHRSTCSPAIVTQEGPAQASEVFVPVSARDETATDIGSPYPTVRVFVEANPQGLSPRQWAEQGRTVGAAAGERIEDVVYADRPAARKVLTLGGTPLHTYFVANGGRIYVVSPFAAVPSDGAIRQTIIRMIESFRFLTDAELAAARAAVGTPLPPRTPEQVVDGVATAMAAKNADALTGFLAACVTTAVDQADGTFISRGFVSREKYVDDLRGAFATGLVVTVQPRPLEGDRASGNLTAASTWRETITRERKLVLRRGENDRWELQGTLQRF
jgi:hypothetical protein